MGASPSYEERRTRSSNPRADNGQIIADDQSEPRSAGSLPKGQESAARLPEWQGKRTIHPSSKQFEVARWPAWASIRKVKVSFDAGAG